MKGKKKSDPHLECKSKERALEAQLRDAQTQSIRAQAQVGVLTKIIEARLR